MWRWPLTWHGARVVQHWQRLTGMQCFKLLLKTEESRGEPTQKWAITYEGRKWVSFNRKVQQQHSARIFPLATLRDNYRVTIFWLREKWYCQRCVKAGSGLHNKATSCLVPGAALAPALGTSMEAWPARGYRPSCSVPGYIHLCLLSIFTMNLRLDTWPLGHRECGLRFTGFSQSDSSPPRLWRVHNHGDESAY